MLNANKTKYYYEDSHLYFWFGEYHSSKYKLFMISNNDLKLENDASSTTEYQNAMFQEGTYLLGTSRKQKTFKRKVAAEGLTLNEYKNMMLWLREGSTGFLCFDSNPYWGWSAVLEKVGDATVYYSHSGLVVEFELTWKTVGTYLATNRYISMGIDSVPDKNVNYIISSGNEYGLPSYVGVDTVDEEESGYQQIDIFNIGNQGQQIDITTTFPTNATSTFKLQLVEGSTNTPYAEVQLNADPQSTSGSVVFSYYGGSNFILVDDILAELHQQFRSSSQVNGLLTLTGPAPLLLGGDTLTQSDWEDLTLLGYTHVIASQALMDTATWDVDIYPANEGDNGASLFDHKLRIYQSSDLSAENLTLNRTFKYYAVSSNRIRVTSAQMESTLLRLGVDPDGRLNYRVLGPAISPAVSVLNRSGMGYTATAGSVQLVVHNYNNL